MSRHLRPTSHCSHADALDTWRVSSELVGDRWHQFSVADRETRPFMFAAYVAALDHEEAAAAELEMFSPPSAGAVALFTLDRVA